MNKREVGKAGEDTAIYFLQNKGLEIIARNYYTFNSEIDIVAREKEYLVFVEVKERKSDEFGNPLYAVTKVKQKRLVKAAMQFMYENHYSQDTFVRFDVIGINGSNINWIQNAFY